MVAGTGGGAAKPGRGWLSRLLLAVTLVAVVVVAWRALPEIDAAFDALGSIRPTVVAFALLLEIVAVALLPQVYRASLRAFGADVAYPAALQVSMGAFTLSRVVPVGGAAGGLYALQRLMTLGVSPAVAGAAVTVEGLLAMATLALLVAVGASAATLAGAVPPVYVGAVVATGAAFFLVLVAGGWVLSSTAARGWLARRLEATVGRRRGVGGWRERFEEVAGVLPPLRRLAPVVGWSSLNWGFDIAALWIVFRSLDVRVGLGVLLLGFAAANLLTALPHTPGGVGVVEVGMSAAYVALGVPAASAIGAVLAYRILAYWLPVLAGIPQYLRGRAAPRQRAVLP